MLGEGKDVAEVCRELGVAEQTYYRWRNQFGGLKADDAKRLKDLERENTTLKRLLADTELEKAALKDAKGNFRARHAGRRPCTISSRRWA
jgi:transposase-like protein